MFIKSLTIKNFRCFGKNTDDTGTTIKLNKRLTAFISSNGSGKTAILEALNFLIGSDYLPTRINETLVIPCNKIGIYKTMRKSGEYFR